MFRLFADNNQCKHIFFAGCHDTGYLSMITPYRGKTDRITLVKAASFHPEFERLDLPVRELPSVFMSTQSTGNRAPSPTISISTAPKICTYYQKVVWLFLSFRNAFTDLWSSPRAHADTVAHVRKYTYHPVSSSQKHTTIPPGSRSRRKIRTIPLRANQNFTPRTFHI
jgi:hypothetical protein